MVSSKTRTLIIDNNITEHYFAKTVALLRLFYEN